MTLQEEDLNTSELPVDRALYRCSAFFCGLGNLPDCLRLEMLQTDFLRGDVLFRVVLMRSWTSAIS